MAGTRRGGRTARDKNYELYGQDFYRRVGALGGAKSRGGGFSGQPELAGFWGGLGGRISRRGGRKEPNLPRPMSERQRIRAQYLRKYAATYRHLSEVHRRANG